MEKFMFFYSFARAQELRNSGFKILGRCRLFSGHGEKQYTNAVKVTQAGTVSRKYPDATCLGTGYKISEHLTELPEITES